MERRRTRRDQTFAAIGQYVVLSVIIAGFLLINVKAVPFWCAFPLATIWLILNDTLRVSDIKNTRK